MQQILNIDLEAFGIFISNHTVALIIFHKTLCSCTALAKNIYYKIIEALQMSYPLFPLCNTFISSKVSPL